MVVRVTAPPYNFGMLGLGTLGLGTLGLGTLGLGTLGLGTLGLGTLAVGTLPVAGFPTPLRDANRAFFAAARLLINDFFCMSIPQIEF